MVLGWSPFRRCLVGCVDIWSEVEMLGVTRVDAIVFCDCKQTAKNGIARGITDPFNAKP